MTEKSNLEIVREKVIAAVPEIMELKFGCRVDWAGGEFIVIYECGKCTKHKRYKSCDMDCDFEDAVEVSNIDEFNPGTLLIEKKLLKPYDILGRTIRLADVLVAIDNCNDDNPPALTAEGQFCQYDPETGTMHLSGEYWNLRNDDLSAQSEETVAFLASLLS